jgi:hypothetical protein
MKRFLALSVSLSLIALSLAGCGGSSTKSSTSSQAGAVYVTGEDAPLSSVVSLNLTINSITLKGAKSSPVLVSAPITVEFARLVGLRAPLGFGAVPADTYSSVTLVLASPVISYIPTAGAVTVTTLNGTFSAPTSTAPQTTSVTVAFPTPMVVGANGLAGLHTEFDIPKSLAVDGTGQVTGVITPVMFAESVKATDPDGQITELTGTIAAVNTSSSSFTLNGPFGKQVTVAVNSSTTFNQSFTLATLPTTGGFVTLQGTMQQDGSILASDVEFITTDLAFVAGRVLALTPPTGPAVSVTLWVSETGGATSTLQGTVQTVNVAAATYGVSPFNNGWFTTTGMFTSSSMLVGQRILVGGTFLSSVFTPDFVSLRRQGVYGAVVPASVVVTSGSAGTFQLSNAGLLGYELAAPLKVNTGTGTVFFQGNSNALTLTGLGTASATTSVGVVARGLILKDSISGNAVLWAHRIREVEVGP